MHCLFPCGLYRDIKPENILCSGAEWPFDVKLTVRWGGGRVWWAALVLYGPLSALVWQRAVRAVLLCCVTGMV